MAWCPEKPKVRLSRPLSAFFSCNFLLLYFNPRVKSKVDVTSYAFESGRVMLYSYRVCNAGGLTLQVLHIAFKEILV